MKAESLSLRNMLHTTQCGPGRRGSGTYQLSKDLVHLLSKRRIAIAPAQNRLRCKNCVVERGWPRGTEHRRSNVDSVFRWRRFAPEVILPGVRWYCKYGISYRDLEEMMPERGIAVDHTTLYR